MNLTVKEMLKNAIDELQRASERIKELTGDSLLGKSVGEDEDLLNDMAMSIERLPDINNIILVALNAAVYAGNIEGEGKGFIGDFGADSLAHRKEYLEIAEQYDLPYQDDGLIATDCVYDDISEIVHSKYCTKGSPDYEKTKE